MGSKKIKLNPFLIAALTIVFIWINFSGCQEVMYPKVSMESADSQQGNEFLQMAAGHIIDKDLDLALIESNKALKFFPPELRQKAIFQKGVIYGHHDNEAQDLQRAVFYFKIAEKEKEDRIIQAYAGFIKVVLKKAIVQQRVNKKREQNLAAITQDYNTLLAKQDKWHKNVQLLEKENAELKMQVSELNKEMKDFQEKGFEEIVVKEEPLTQ